MPPRRGFCPLEEPARPCAVPCHRRLMGRGSRGQNGRRTMTQPTVEWPTGPRDRESRHARGAHLDALRADRAKASPLRQFRLREEPGEFTAVVRMRAYHSGAGAEGSHEELLGTSAHGRCARRRLGVCRASARRASSSWAAMTSSSSRYCRGRDGRASVGGRSLPCGVVVAGPPERSEGHRVPLGRHRGAWIPFRLGSLRPLT